MDDPGSARKILFAEDLEVLDASQNGFMSSEFKDWDTYLLDCRSKHEALRYTSMKERKDESMFKHQQTIEACKAVKASNWKLAAELYYKASEVPPSVITVEICFVMDCTGSMSQCIAACQEKVIAIADTIAEHIGRDNRIRMAFIAYRDYVDASEPLKYDSPGKRDVCHFTEDIGQLRKFVSAQKASGGGDGPEDICGGLCEASALDWEGENRHLFLIADAPCHGSKYHSMQDNFPGGDPMDLVPEIQFEHLMDSQKVSCNFLQITDSTDQMMTIINTECKRRVGQEVSVISLKDGGTALARELEEAVTSSVLQDLKMHFC
mmetsp:Transcript_33136/g.48414  ORF Transcript_33136/g.48414 Transcript_33136/m.48414 type:complete len:321 (-) Transcript_33136:685-1647(-)